MTGATVSSATVSVSGLATGPSLVPVMVMVRVEVDVPPLPSEIV